MSGRAWPWAVFVPAFVTLCGCDFNRAEHAQFCRTDSECDTDERCVQSFCVQREASEDDAGPRDSDGGSAGEPCEDGQPPEPCYDGEAATRDVGPCRGGERACVGGVYTQCLGQVVPAADTCNQVDDDCDGTIDEVEASCPDTGTGLPGICNEGVLLCHGSVPVCTPVNEAQDEVCNGLDDDCDRETDEIAPVVCFPQGESGCAANDDGTFTCTGQCRTGMSACEGGESRCENAVVAAEEDCTAASGIAGDEDCDGEIDEGCTCSTGATRPCYGGPAGTEDHAPCARGTQECVAETWGPCQGQVLPQDETCANQGQDDDCDGTRDDVEGLNEACIDGDEQGICRIGTKQCQGAGPLPVCVGQAPQEEQCDDIDQDCDGDRYDYDLNSDENCGACGHRCEDGTHCCNFECRSPDDFRHDAKNCGGCGRACGAGYYCCWNDCIPNGDNGGPGFPSDPLPPKDNLCGCEEDCRDKSCCGSSCVDLMNDPKNCGSCGNDCSSVSIRSFCCNGVCSAFLCVAEQ